MGFSQQTSLPAAMAALAMGACMKLGVAISTRSISGLPMIDFQSPEAYRQFQLSAKFCGFSSGSPQTVCMTPRSGGSKNLFTWLHAFEWVRPMKP
jgi:hypothetical protein